MSIIVSLCRSARLREARRADLARYFGAQLAPSAALQAADATLTQALEVSSVCSEAKPIAAYTNDVPWHQDKPEAACPCTARLGYVGDLQRQCRFERTLGFEPHAPGSSSERG